MRKHNSIVTGVYEAPSVKCFPMKAHEVICTSGPYGVVGGAGFFLEDEDPNNVHIYDEL